MSLVQLPPHVEDLLKDYVGQSCLRELPDCFSSLQHAVRLHKTTRGASITYKHRNTGETLQVTGYPWKSTTKTQQVVVASGRSLPEPVIIVPAQKGSTDLKIWKGEGNSLDDTPCPVYKVFGKVDAQLPMLAAKMPPQTIAPAQNGDVIMCRCSHDVEEGNMVICEECDTWQHVICYYPNELVPAVHFCEDCGSRYQDEKRATKRRKYDHKGAVWNHHTSGPTKPEASDRSVTEAVHTRRNASPEHGSHAILDVVAAFSEQETSSDDEPLISKPSKIHASGVSEIKVEAAGPRLADRRQGAMSVEKAKYAKIPLIDLTNDTEDAVTVKIELHNHHLLGNARRSPTTFMSVAPTAALHLPSTPMATPVMTPQPTQPARSSFRAGDCHQPVSNATTLIFLDSQNKELRRRTFEDFGGRLNVSILFGQAIRAGLIDRFDDDAILSVSIRGVSEAFKILRDDKPDFAYLMQRIEAAGLCIVEVRLD